MSPPDMNTTRVCVSFQAPYSITFRCLIILSQVVFNGFSHFILDKFKEEFLEVV